MRCWWCGAVPDDVDIVSTFDDPEARYLVLGWDLPARGHSHSLHPPTPDQLGEAGWAALQRILEEAL